jgi:hypothetical protein
MLIFPRRGGGGSVASSGHTADKTTDTAVISFAFMSRISNDKS